MEGKKISFGFMKTKKQEKPVLTDKKDYIECVEEKAIKVIGGEAIQETKPLVIPMKPNTLITAEKLKEIAEKAENFDEPEVKSERPEDVAPDNETLDQMAIRELIEDAKKEKVVETEKLVLPVNAKPVLEGQAEATLDDYESVPIQEFGMAMLRGMGWTPGKDQSKYKQPQLRPKGLGLGADKVIKVKEKSKASKDKEEELSIVKNSFVKITTGKYNGLYGKVISLDEENGRVMVDITVKKETVSLSEFMMQSVTKSEFDKQSKVINTESYDEYKRKEMLKTSKETKTEDYRKDGSSSKKPNDVRDKDYLSERQRDDKYSDEKYSNGRSRNNEKAKERHRKQSSSSEEERTRHKKKNKKKYSSNESLSSESDHRHKSIEKRRHSTSDTSDSNYRKKSHKSKSSKGKRDIDKKRKGKKKKRDRDRSPNYKKYKK